MKDTTGSLMKALMEKVKFQIEQKQTRHTIINKQSELKNLTFALNKQ